MPANQLLSDIDCGGATAELIPLVYDELRRLAAHYLRRESSAITLQPTALVHEAYIRLIKLQKVEWQSRSHFFATAATAMRRILVDHARAHQANKREGLRAAISLDEALVVSPARSSQLIALDDALEGLAKLDPRQSQVVELRFFTGLSIEETAAALDLSKATVNRYWVTARAWLLRELKKQ